MVFCRESPTSTRRNDQVKPVGLLNVIEYNRLAVKQNGFRFIAVVLWEQQTRGIFIAQPARFNIILVSTESIK